MYIQYNIFIYNIKYIYVVHYDIIYTFIVLFVYHTYHHLMRSCSATTYTSLMCCDFRDTIYIFFPSTWNLGHSRLKPHPYTGRKMEAEFINQGGALTDGWSQAVMVSEKNQLSAGWVVLRLRASQPIPYSFRTEKWLVFGMSFVGSTRSV